MVHTWNCVVGEAGRLHSGPGAVILPPLRAESGRCPRVMVCVCERRNVACERAAQNVSKLLNSPSDNPLLMCPNSLESRRCCRLSGW